MYGLSRHMSDLVEDPGGTNGCRKIEGDKDKCHKVESEQNQIEPVWSCLYHNLISAAEIKMEQFSQLVILS